jgi:LCP family protein required for cell wall assembly
MSTSFDSDAELSAEASARIFRTLQREMLASDLYIAPTVHRVRPRHLVFGAFALATATVLLGVGYAVVQYRRIHRVDIHAAGPDLTVAVSEPSPTVAVTTTVAGVPITAKTFLIIGSDSRDCIDPKSPQAGAFLGGEATGSNADTIMLARVDPVGPAVLLSLPRDLWVKVPDSSTRSTKISSLYQGRNPVQLVRAIEQNFSLHIDHYIDVDFCGFRDIVDSLGGVAVPFEYPAFDKQTGLNVDTGCHRFDGEEALAYVRSRYYQWFNGSTWQVDGDSDLSRIARQQDFVKRLLAKAIDRGLANPIVAKRLLDAAVAHLTVDVDLTLDELVRFATTLKSSDADAVRGFRLDGWFSENGDAIIADLETPTNKAVLAVMRGDARLASVVEPPATASAADVPTVEAPANTVGVVPPTRSTCGL